MRRHENHPARQNELSHIPGFRGCSPRQLSEIDRLTDRTNVLPGRVLVREGMIGRELFVIVSGEAIVTRHGRVVTTLGPGDYFGELAAVNPGPRNATVTALTELDVLIIGPRELATMFEIPGFRDSLLRTMAGRLREADADLEAVLEVHEPEK